MDFQARWLFTFCNRATRPDKWAKLLYSSLTQGRLRALEVTHLKPHWISLSISVECGFWHCRPKLFNFQSQRMVRYRDSKITAFGTLFWAPHKHQTHYSYYSYSLVQIMVYRYYNTSCDGSTCGLHTAEKEARSHRVLVIYIRLNTTVHEARWNKSYKTYIACWGPSACAASASLGESSWTVRDMLLLEHVARGRFELHRGIVVLQQGLP